jgi:hypothetical protein
MQVPIDEIGKIRSVLTIMDGRIVHADAPCASLTPNKNAIRSFLVDFVAKIRWWPCTTWVELRYATAMAAKF